MKDHWICSLCYWLDMPISYQSNKYYYSTILDISQCQIKVLTRHLFILFKQSKSVLLTLANKNTKLIIMYSILPASSYANQTIRLTKSASEGSCPTQVQPCTRDDWCARAIFACCEVIAKLYTSCTQGYKNKHVPV